MLGCRPSLLIEQNEKTTAMQTPVLVSIEAQSGRVDLMLLTIVCQMDRVVWRRPCSHTCQKIHADLFFGL